MPKPGLRRGAGAGPAQLVRGARQIDNFLKEKIIVGGAGGGAMVEMHMVQFSRVTVQTRNLLNLVPVTVSLTKCTLFTLEKGGTLNGAKRWTVLI